jgi:hypothetical protein
VRWLQWNTRTVPERRFAYCIGRDVTDRRRADAELRETQRMVEASRDELAASRARIVASTVEERRRVVRDLHDGAQQRLVHTVITLKQARRALGNEVTAGAALVTEGLDQPSARWPSCASSRTASSQRFSPAAGYVPEWTRWRPGCRCR